MVHAYRHLYQEGLRAVRFSGPARYTIRDRLRRAFRKSHPGDFDANRISNTLQFLHGAARYNSLEHQVLRSLLMTWYWEDNSYQERKRMELKSKDQASKERELEIINAARDQFNHLIRMLNESMGMCLR